jgi:hypothetical protein
MDKIKNMWNKLNNKAKIFVSVVSVLVVIEVIKSVF